MLETLDLFEKDSLNSYIVKKARDEEGKMETKIANMENKLKELEEHLGDNPTNTTNDWGEDIATDRKLYLTDEDDEEDDHSDGDKNSKVAQKQRQRKLSRHVIFQDDVEDLEEQAVVNKPRKPKAGHKTGPNDVVMNKLEMMEEKIRMLDGKTSAALTQMESVLMSIKSSLDSRR